MNDPAEIDKFLMTMTSWGLERDPQAMISFIVDIVPLEVLNEVVRAKQSSSAILFENVFDWAAEHAELCPEPDETLESFFCSEWRKFRPVVFYFIPNMINIFLGAFNFLDTRRKYTTLWEKHLLLEIVYKFFIIPYFIYKLLSLSSK